MQVVSHVVFLWIGTYVAHNEKINTFRYRSSIPISGDYASLVIRLEAAVDRRAPE